jgi:peptidoglycan/LPS O-acetylase OafA/YrhL
VEKLGYRPALNGVRGIAVALVVSAHTFGWPSDGGYFGLDLFFVLSGFLITRLLLDEHASTGAISFRRFYERRVRRLLPALTCLLIACFLLASVALMEHHIDHHQYRQSLVVGVLASVFSLNFVAKDLVGAPASILGHLWSLSLEEQFYIVWPATLALLLKLRGRRGAAIVLAVGVAVAEWRMYSVAAGTNDMNRVYFYPDTHAAPIAAGCLIAFAPTIGQSRVIGPGALAVLLLAAILGHATNLHSYLTYSPVVTLAAVGVISACMAGGAFARALSWRPLVWLGVVSYSLYLWHYPIVWLLPNSAPLALALSVLVASISYYLVERSFLRRSPRQRAAPVPVPASLPESA